MRERFGEEEKTTQEKTKAVYVSILNSIMFLLSLFLSIPLPVCWKKERAQFWAAAKIICKAELAKQPSMKQL